MLIYVTSSFHPDFKELFFVTVADKYIDHLYHGDSQGIIFSTRQYINFTLWFINGIVILSGLGMNAWEFLIFWIIWLAFCSFNKKSFPLGKMVPIGTS